MISPCTVIHLVSVTSGVVSPTLPMVRVPNCSSHKGDDASYPELDTSAWPEIEALQTQEWIQRSA